MNSLPMPCEDTFYICTIGSIYIGIPSREVQHIVDPRPVSKIPLTPLYAVGAFIHQGLSTSVVDLREKFRLEKSAIERSSALIIMQLETDKAAAFFVDHISEEQELPKGKALEFFAENSLRAVKQNEKIIYFTSLHYLLNASRDLFDNSKTAENIETIETPIVINQQLSKNILSSKSFDSGELNQVKTNEKTVIMVDKLISKLPEHLPLASAKFKQSESVPKVTHDSNFVHNTNIIPLNTHAEESNDEPEINVNKKPIQKLNPPVSIPIRNLEEKQIELSSDDKPGDIKPLLMLNPPKSYFENEYQIENTDIDLTNDEIPGQELQGLESNFDTEETNEFQMPNYQDFDYSWIINNHFIKSLTPTLNSSPNLSFSAKNNNEYEFSGSTFDDLDDNQVVKKIDPPIHAQYREQEKNLEVIECESEADNVEHKAEILENELKTDVEDTSQNSEIINIQSDSNTLTPSTIAEIDTIDDQEQTVNEKHNQQLSIKLPNINRRIFTAKNSHSPIIVSSILLMIGGFVMFSLFNNTKIKELEALQNNITLTENTPINNNNVEFVSEEIAPVVLSIQSPEISIEVRRFEKQITERVDISLEKSSPPAKFTAPMVSEEIALTKLVQQQTIKHIVIKGDTLWSLALTYLENPYLYPEIANFNGIKNPNLIHPKDIVIIKRKNKLGSE